REHVVLERGRIAERLRTERWDSLGYEFVNSSSGLRGLAYQGSEQDEVSHYTAITKFIEDYAARIAAPVCQGVEVTRLQQGDADRFLLETGNQFMNADRVVIAPGPFPRAMIPAAGKELPRSIYQVHASRYRGSGDLPPGAVLVVGSGASGAQIAE